MSRDESTDIAAAAAALSQRLPEPLAPLARIAYNYWWSWTPGGPDLFCSLDPHRWALCGENPIRLLQEVLPSRLSGAAADAAYVARLNDMSSALSHELERPSMQAWDLECRPVAFMCAEFGVHGSLPIYAGGLGVLAGDLLKEASDRAVPMVGVGLLYAQGSFHQRLDQSGWQHEYWLDIDAERLPLARVTVDGGCPLTVSVPIRGREVTARIWRVDVGRVPLFLLDADCPENAVVDRWITSRLYIGDQETRLAQYALLGLGGVRALKALGIEPAFLHLNEGHAALASVALLGAGLGAGLSLEQALEDVRSRVVFTTHTPVAAGNDTFSPQELAHTLDGLSESVGIGWDRVLALGRSRPDDPNERFSMTAFALRTSRAANGVSRRHGEVARTMWRLMWPGRRAEEVPIGHITNGVHLPTWMAPAMQELLDRHFPPSWRERITDPRIWDAVNLIPDDEIWETRRRLRAEIVAYVRDRSIWDRLEREESTGYAEAAARSWNADTLTIGFARRIATYKRLYLLSIEIERGLRLLNGERPLQMVIAGKAHPRDEEAKRTVQRIFALNDLPGVGGRVVFLEEHDLSMAARLVQGCDLWINLPRPPQEASGTSGMKSALNGGLQLSVLDGWWAEAYDGENGWAIPAEEGLDAATQDQRDAQHLYDLLESEVIPLFYSRSEDGVPHDWIRRIKSSLRTLAPRFVATRMLNEYIARGRSQIRAARIN